MSSEGKSVCQKTMNLVLFVCKDIIYIIQFGYHSRGMWSPAGQHIDNV
jgi:hypothetical protein